MESKERIFDVLEFGEIHIRNNELKKEINFLFPFGEKWNISLMDK